MESTYVIYEDNQGAIFLAKNRQVGLRKKHINICHIFLRYMVEYRDINIHYIRNEDNPDYIINKNILEAYFERHMRRITEREFWELVDTGRDNFKKTGVTDDVITCDKTEYSSHVLDVVLDRTNRNG